MGKTLAEKIWDEHVVRSAEGEPDLLFIDLHLIHEVTSPQAFDGLRLSGRSVRRPDLTLATEDHNVPTVDWDKPIADPVSRTQVETLRKNCADSPVMSRRRASTGPAVASNRSSPAAADSSESRGPRTKRPCMSRATSRWCSSATARRCAVGRARPVPATRPASVAGPDSSAASTRAALSSTPTPLVLSI